MRLRDALAESGPDGSGIGSRGSVDLGDRPREAGLRHVTEGAGLVSIDRELLVVEPQLAKQFDLLHLIVGRPRQAIDSFRLNVVDLVLDASDRFESRLGKRRDA